MVNIQNIEGIDFLMYFLNMFNTEQGISNIEHCASKYCGQTSSFEMPKFSVRYS